MTEVLLTVNVGSSTLKLSVFSYLDSLPCLYQVLIELDPKSSSLRVSDANQQVIYQQQFLGQGIAEGMQAFDHWFRSAPEQFELKAVGHRVVHGGADFVQATLVTADLLQKLAALIPLAPFHQPQNLEAIRIIQALNPTTPQFACFDSAFHQTNSKLNKTFAIPRQWTDAGLIRYGFHGLSYEYIASVMKSTLGECADQRVLVAHLGNGSSICAMFEGKSVATSMGLTALDGLMMGTRAGTIDPGLILYWLEEKKLSLADLKTLLYKESGLLGVSGLSHDMRDLELSQQPEAWEAIDLYCSIAARELCALSVSVSGCDAIIFTAGIGENSALVRQKIGEHLQWLGLYINEQANQSHSTIISDDKKSRIRVAVIPSNENQMIAAHTWQALTKKALPYAI